MTAKQTLEDSILQNKGSKGELWISKSQPCRGMLTRAHVLARSQRPYLRTWKLSTSSFICGTSIPSEYLMNSVFHIRRLAIPQRQILQLYRAYTADSKTFKGEHFGCNTKDDGTDCPTEGDIVLLRPSKDPSHSGILTKPLNQSQTIQTKDGALKHSAIIGRRVRDPITSLKGTEYRVYEPSLAEYVSLTPRIVTPVREPFSRSWICGLPR